MKKSKKKSKKTPALNGGKKNDKDVVHISLIERVRHESEEVSTAPGRKREITRMAFALWLTIPTRFKGAPDTVIAALGISDPDILELIKIKNVEQFKEVCNVGHGSMAIWRKEIMEGEEGIDIRHMFRGLMKEGVSALYQGLLEHKDAERFKAFAGFVEGWMPGLQLRHSGNVDTLDDEERKALDELLLKNTK